MTNEQLVSPRFPYLPVRVYGRSINYEGDALVDTGFAGGVILPSSYQPDDVSPARYREWTLGDGSRRNAPTYRGRVAIDGFPLLPFPIAITIMGNEPIIGVRVIRHFSVILDHGRRVIVES